MHRNLLQCVNRRRFYSKITINHLLSNHKSKIPVTCVTAHDYLTARMVDTSPNVDIALIGDSLAMTTLGYKSTVELPFESFYSNATSVSRGIKQKFLISDLPFGSFESSVQKCIETSIKLYKLGNIDAIKLEGAYSIENQIKALLKNGIQVCGHLGLQPQKSSIFGGYKVQSKTASQAIELYKEVRFLRDIGVKMLVLECIPSKVAEFITNDLNILTIGIGAGNGTSGQVLVISDLLGMSEVEIDHEVSSPSIDISTASNLSKYLPSDQTVITSPKNSIRYQPKFVNQYTDLFKIGRTAIDLYGSDVKARKFPTSEHAYSIKDNEWEEFLSIVKTV